MTQRRIASVALLERDGLIIAVIEFFQQPSLLHAHTEGRHIHEMRLCSYNSGSIHGSFVLHSIQPDQEVRVVSSELFSFWSVVQQQNWKKCLSSVPIIQFPSRIAYRSAFRNRYCPPSGMDQSFFDVFPSGKWTIFPSRVWWMSYFFFLSYRG